MIQDTFIEALTSLERLRDETRLGSWMKSLTFHMVCRYFRRYQRHRRVELYDPEFLEAHFATEPPVSRTLIHEAFAHMTNQDAELFFKRYAEGYKIDELARHFGRSPSTIKRSLASGRTRMRRRLEQEAWEFPNSSPKASSVPDDVLT